MLPLFRSALVLVSVLALGTSSASALSSFNNLVVFGDSIVDQGNTQAAAVGAGFPDPAPAAAGYFGGRFTNGINLADVLNLAVEGTHSIGSTFGGDNYAFGGARARNDGDFLPDVAAQTQLYLVGPTGTGGTGGVADPSTLYMINVGGNDIRDIVIGGLVGAARQTVIDDAVSAITSSIALLQSANAQHILFVGVGDVGSIPEVLAMGGSAAADGRQGSLDLNAAIQAALPVGVQFFDSIGLFDAVLANPAAFGFPAGINTTAACLTSGLAAPGGPPTCNDYSFFDNVHPTTQLQQYWGTQVVAAVPEPSTSLLVSLGLALLAARRKQSGPHSG